MPVILDSNNFDSLLLDTNHVGYLAENFSYLIQNLIDFVAYNPDGSVVGNHKNYSELVGGKRRIVRAMRSTQLGYQYQLEAGKLKTASGGSRIINAFGSNIMVEEWTVSHPHVVDSDLGEEYPTSDNATKKRPAEPRGPYTCLMTARISLSKQTPTRCYVQCNCKDFQTTFYEKLNKQGYTNAQSLPAATGKRTLAPAICKHLYAIYSQHYTDLVNSIENFEVDENPALFGSGQGTETGETNPIVEPTGPVVARSKKEALDLIGARLKQEFARFKGNKDAYLDTRGKRDGGGSYHLYPFFLVAYNGSDRAIAYRNKNVADPAHKNNAPLQILQVPDNPQIWKYFKSLPDNNKLWELIRALGQMSKQMNALIKRNTGMAVYMEDVDQTPDVTRLLEEPKTSILLSISELN